MADPRITALKSKIRAREGKPEFAENVADLKRELERLETTTEGEDR